MTTYSSSKGAALERAYHHWRERGSLQNRPVAKDDETPITIAISREYGAGGSVIAQAIADRLDWPIYDRELVEKIAADSGVRSQLLDQLDERQPNWLTECLESFNEEKPMSGVGFAIRLREILLALYFHGSCVIVGRGAAQVLPAKQTLRVRLIAPKLYRVQQATDRLGISCGAAHEVTERDRQRNAFVKHYFHQDPADVHGYDLVIDTSRFDTTDCLELILMALKNRRSRGNTNNCKKCIQPTMPPNNEPIA